jgi:hypothetical protein
MSMYLHYVSSCWLGLQQYNRRIDALIYTTLSTSNECIANALIAKEGLSNSGACEEMISLY